MAKKKTEDGLIPPELVFEGIDNATALATLFNTARRQLIADGWAPERAERLLIEVARGVAKS